MSRISLAPVGPPRPEFECEPVDASGIGDVERPLGFAESESSTTTRCGGLSSSLRSA